MDVARQHVGYPPGKAVGAEDRLGVAAEVVGLPRVPQADLLPFLAQRLDADAAGVDGLAVEDQVRRSVGFGPLPGLEQVRPERDAARWSRALMTGGPA
jgi:hypothetical protein